MDLTHQSPLNAAIREAAASATSVSLNKPKQVGPLPERRASLQPSEEVRTAKTSSITGHSFLAGWDKSLVLFARECKSSLASLVRTLTIVYA